MFSTLLSRRIFATEHCWWKISVWFCNSWYFYDDTVQPLTCSICCLIILLSRIPHWLCMFKDIALFYWHTLTLVWVERAFFIFNSEHCFCTCVALCYRRHYNRAKIECLLCFILYELCMGWDWLHSLNSYLFQSNCPDVPDFYNYLQYEWSGFPSNYYF